ncbi:MAG: hypothetical protein K2P09_04960 [Erysipelotrichales bacterium]|nr:hypothetical protein [Erysipelotrichales bacterium]
MQDIYDFIKQKCLESESCHPLTLIQEMMKDERIHMHGPEHHVLDGSCLLVALHNVGMDFDLEKALDEMMERGRKMPGATCGQWGVCGSAASLGAALAIVHKTTPLSSNEYYKDNLKYVSKALDKIGDIGGPRCCKRNAFLSMLTMIDFVKERYGIELEKENVECEFSSMNKQCIKEECPFFKR